MTHPIGDLMSTTMQKIKEMIDVNTIVGAPIRTDDGVTIVPVSKVSFGFAAGGSDFTGKHQQQDQDNSFGGGSAAGINIMPVAFLIINGDSVRILPVHQASGSAVDRVVDAVPDVLDKVTDFLNKRKEKKQDKDASLD